MYNYGDHEINHQRFPQWDGFFSFSYHKITLFEKKYDIKLITLISVYYLKPLVSLDRFINPMSRGVFLSSNYAGGGFLAPHRKPTSALNFSTKFGMHICLCMNFKFQF